MCSAIFSPFLPNCICISLGFEGMGLPTQTPPCALHLSSIASVLMSLLSSWFHCVNRTNIFLGLKGKGENIPQSNKPYPYHAPSFHSLTLKHCASVLSPLCPSFPCPSLGLVPIPCQVPGLFDQCSSTCLPCPQSVISWLSVSVMDRVLLLPNPDL